MNIKSSVVLAGVSFALIFCDVNLAESAGFGIRGGASVRSGIGGTRNTNVRYDGPAFYAAPRTYGANRQGSTQYQQSPWYYSRSGPFEYYRPYNPLYRAR